MLLLYLGLIAVSWKKGYNLIPVEVRQSRLWIGRRQMSEGAVKLVDGLEMSTLSRGSGVHLSSKGMYEEYMVGLDGEECTSGKWRK